MLVQSKNFKLNCKGTDLLIWMGLFLDAVGLQELVVWSANLHLSQIKSPKPEHILFLKKNESMENPEMFTVNPSFLNEVWKDNECNLFDFHFELNEDGTLKQADYKWQILDPNIWAWLFIVRHEYIKQKRKAESNYSKKIKAVEKREEYKAEMQRMISKNHRQKMDNKYQTDTCRLYRKILEHFVRMDEEGHTEQ